MKTFVLLALMMGSGQAFAGNLIKNPEAAIGAEVIARQVIHKKMLGKDGMRQLKFALEGSGNSSIRADIASMYCEATLGSTDCLIHLNVTDDSRPAGFKDISWEFNVKIYQGTVTSVYFTNEP